jgi:hypothetical protein
MILPINEERYSTPNGELEAVNRRREDNTMVLSEIYGE